MNPQVPGARVPAPGTDNGPCGDHCQHGPCLLARATAEERCPICSDPIGFDTSFWFVSARLVHAGGCPTVIPWISGPMFTDSLTDAEITAVNSALEKPSPT